MYKLRFFLLLILLYGCSTDKPDDPIDDPIDNPVFDFTIIKISNLSSEMEETSGLINFNGRIITHNDGGGDPNLYEIDLVSGEVKRTVAITNASNIDWEDVAQDDEYIYLCDIGNNSNTRQDQVIYKIDKGDYLNNNSVTAEKITISYTEQTDFSKTERSTNFDAEAVVSVGNNLFLFTKNWGDLKTTVYKIPKEKGSYELSGIDSYNMQGLITGADHNEKTNVIILTGYVDFSPFIVKLSDFPQDNPLGGLVEKKSASVPGSIQIEGVAANPDGTYYISAEKLSALSAVLYKMTLAD